MNLLREYIRELLTEAPTITHKGDYNNFRVELGRIGYAQGGAKLRFQECQADVDTIMQMPEYLEAQEKFEANNTKKDPVEDPDSPNGFRMVESPAKFTPRFYEVNNAWIHDEKNRGKGHGKEIYKAFIDQAVEYSKKAGGVFIGSHKCVLGSGTSEDAGRVWDSLGKDYTSSGQVIFIGL
jgi:hypothetical protein